MVLGRGRAKEWFFTDFDVYGDSGTDGEIQGYVSTQEGGEKGNRCNE